MAVAVVVLAVIAIAAVAVLNSKDTEVATPSPYPSPITEAPEPEEPDLPKPPSPVAARPVGTQPEVTAAAPAPEPDAPVEEVPDVRERMVKLLDSLSDEERKVLGGEMWRRAKQAKREYYKYALPTDHKLLVLSKLGDGLQLTDAQWAQVKELKEAFKPQIEVAMQNVWAREAEVGKTVRELWEAGEQEAATTMKAEEYMPLHEEMAEIKAELDIQYNERLAGILTPEQIKEMAEMPGASNRGGK